MTRSTLDEILAFCEEEAASDVHLSSGRAPRFRIKGSLVEAGAFGPLDERAVDAVAMELARATLGPDASEGDEGLRRTLHAEGSLDGALTAASGARYRFNLYRERDRNAVALRRLDGRFRTMEELGIPAKLRDFCDEHEGLVIVTGPTGSGKSTTLATLIDIINTTRDGHVITIEDPIEFIHESKRCLVHQRQVGRDTKSFNDALVESLRQDPDVILVGEVRDLATIRTALRAAETGHLVFTTLHAGDCAGAVERLVSVYPADEQISARRQLSLVLRGIFAQHLLPTPSGDARHPACELLVNTTACANLIASGRTNQLYSVMETGSGAGMMTMDASLANLLKAGCITERAALTLSHNPETVRRRAGC